MTHVVAETHAHNSGKSNGMNSTASMTSFPRVFMVMVESMVPTPAMPTVPAKSGAIMSGHVGAAPTCPRNRKKNRGTVTAVTTRRNIRLAVAFARKMTERSMGTSRMPSRHPCSFSCEKERFRPRRLVNRITAHSRPPAICRISSSLPACASAAP